MFCFLHGGEPVLHYDFSGPVIRQGGQFEAPEFVGNVEIDPEQGCIQIQPGNYLAVPESASLSLLNGGTLYAVVFLDDDGTKNGSDDSYDMLFFKDSAFLMGRSRGELCCNLGDGEKWQNGVFCPVPVKQWCTLAMSAEKQLHKGETFYIIEVYVNGEQVRRVTWRFEGKDNRAPVTFGRGFGGPWFMKGKIAEMRIYPYPVRSAECKRISEESLRRRGKESNGKE
jgi:hypothetical protein